MIENEWRLISRDPPGKCGDQVDVIFGHPDWGWPLWGMVNCWGTLEEWSAKTLRPELWPGTQYEWFIYDQKADRYRPWNKLKRAWDKHLEPTHWMPRPRSPKA